MQLAQRHTGSRGLDRRFLRGQNGCVHLFLPRRKTAVRRIGPGDVGAIAVELRPAVDEDQVAGLDRAVVVAVVQLERVGAGAHDRTERVACSRGAVRGDQLGIQLVLHDAGPQRGEDALEPRGGDGCRAFDRGDFGPVLDAPKLRDGRGRIVQLDVEETVADRADETGVGIDLPNRRGCGTDVVQP